MKIMIRDLGGFVMHEYESKIVPSNGERITFLGNEVEVSEVEHTLGCEEGDSVVLWVQRT